VREATGVAGHKINDRWGDFVITLRLMINMGDITIICTPFGVSRNWKKYIKRYR
jgi:hypothetical protein